MLWKVSLFTASVISPPHSSPPSESSLMTTFSSSPSAHVCQVWKKEVTSSQRQSAAFRCWTRVPLGPGEPVSLRRSNPGEHVLRFLRAVFNYCDGAQSGASRDFTCPTRLTLASPCSH